MVKEQVCYICGKKATHSCKVYRKYSGMPWTAIPGTFKVCSWIHAIEVAKLQVDSRTENIKYVLTPLKDVKTNVKGTYYLTSDQLESAKKLYGKD